MVKNKKDYDYSRYWEGKYDKRKSYYVKLYLKVKSFYKIPNKSKVLDVGGGNGQFSNFIGAKNVTILDISETGLKFAKKKFKFKIIKKDIRKKWNLTSKNYDIVFCNEVLEHVLDPEFIISEIAKIIKKKGILYIAQPNMKPDGEHHLTRIHFNYLKKILEKNKFKIQEYISIPRLLDNFSYLKNDEPLIKKFILFMENITFLFIPKKLKYGLAYRFPSLIGSFYHVKARKI